MEIRPWGFVVYASRGLDVEGLGGFGMWAWGVEFRHSGFCGGGCASLIRIEDCGPSSTIKPPFAIFFGP